jgi:hypothetical protein
VHGGGGLLKGGCSSVAGRQAKRKVRRDADQPGTSPEQLREEEGRADLQRRPRESERGGEREREKGSVILVHRESETETKKNRFRDENLNPQACRQKNHGLCAFTAVEAWKQASAKQPASTHHDEHDKHALCGCDAQAAGDPRGHCEMGGHAAGSGDALCGAHAWGFLWQTHSQD